MIHSPHERAPPGPACAPDPAGGRCPVCADHGTEGRIRTLLGDSLAEVEMEGRIAEIAVDLLEEAAVGDRVLVHAGVAIAWLRPRSLREARP